MIYPVFLMQKWEYNDASWDDIISFENDKCQLINACFWNNYMDTFIVRCNSI